jgi:pyrimidine oxygenase
MDVGVFIPIGNNGWLTSTTSPQYMPTFDLNNAIVQKAEKFGFDFALSMIKLHGYGGPSQYWDHNLESFTLMAGLAATTSRIQLFASVAVLTLPPPLAARMAVTIDSISHGRFGLNIVTGWQMAEYDQMGIWPGAEHYQHRYDYCTEYVTVMRELWATGHSDLKGQYFTMKDCRLSPLPSRPIPIICAAQSDRGTKFAAQFGDYNFCASLGVNEPTRCAPSIARLVEANAQTGRHVPALALTTIIADETDDAAMAKWNHYVAGTDFEALAWRDSQATIDTSTDPYSSARRRLSHGSAKLPCSHGVLVGSYAAVAAMLDEMATIPGLQGVMLTFDDFLIGLEMFGQRIQPLMRSRAHMMTTT